MNKKGFMFIETIVTLTVLMALLITIYSVFVNLLNKEKTGAEYNKYGDVMSLFYYKEKLGGAEVETRATRKTISGDKRGSYYYDNQFGLDVNKESDPSKRYCNVVIMTCKELSERRDIKGNIIYEANYGGSYASKCDKGVSNELNIYRKQVKSCPDGNKEDRYVIIAEFKSAEGIYTYAHLYVPNYILY